MTVRDLAPAERLLLEFLLAEAFPGRDELARQAENVQTPGRTCDCGCASFSLVPDYSLRAAQVEERVPIDAFGRDPTGNEVGVLLFVDDGYLSEVEVYPVGDSVSNDVPDPHQLTIGYWTELGSG